MRNSKKGFTIIEVVLVLAIGGLIFLMVFIALPALQRSQRDTQRKDDLARFMSATIEYQKNTTVARRHLIPTSSTPKSASRLLSRTILTINAKALQPATVASSPSKTAVINLLTPMAKLITSSTSALPTQKSVGSKMPQPIPTTN